MIRLVDSAEETQETVEDRQGVRRAAGDEQIHRQNQLSAIANLRVINERSSGDCTGAYGDDEFRGGHRGIRFLKC